MNSPTTDSELALALRKKAAELGYTPLALLSLAEAAADVNRWSVMPNFPPFPQVTDEFVILDEQLCQWPEWSAALIPPGSRMERLNWPDGTNTLRLVSPRGLVLATKIVQRGDPE